MLRTVLILLVIVLSGPVALAAPDTPIDEPVRPTTAPPPVGVTAEARVNEGLALAKKNDWAGAERAYRDAIRLKPTLPEGWNGLGYALRKQQKYDESVRAYQEALRLRPNYPQALEYLGEAYVQLGRLAEAREILARLRPLDPHEAEELAQAIVRASKR